jgi:hypothetical protein
MAGLVIAKPYPSRSLIHRQAAAFKRRRYTEQLQQIPSHLTFDSLFLGKINLSCDHSMAMASKMAK